MLYITDEIIGALPVHLHFPLKQIMRSCLSFLVVEYMRQGRSPQEACRLGIQRVIEISASSSSVDVTESKAVGVENADTTESVQRVHGLHNIHNIHGVSEARQHEQLTVGVVAMDVHGNVGAASSLHAGNQHRGADTFPAVCWRFNPTDPHFASHQLHTIHASQDGASF
jgi:isoaspartyl peptidase/L-asparaginase-like protein (Ntn-hydrolase superfamily)